MTYDQLKSLLDENVADVQRTIEQLKANRALPDITTYSKQLDVNKHDVFDATKRPDKTVKKAEGTSIEKVNRIGIAMQELIAERAVSFLFGNPVKIVCDAADDNQKKILDALNAILDDNKIDSFNAEVALEMFCATEVAECWFPVEVEENDNYGIKTKFKLRSMIFRPSDGNELYPLFDDKGDMIAFSRAYSVIEENKTIQYFETYTAEVAVVWKQSGSDWERTSSRDNPIKKIPIVYGKQKTVEWGNVQTLIDRLEKVTSTFADTTDYHGSPFIKTMGKVESLPGKDTAGKVIQMAAGADAEYLTWDQAPDAVKIEIENLFRLTYSLTQTPDISFESVKGLGDISGIALKILFLDAHLKVKKKQRVFDAYLDRRANIIKAFVGTFSIELKSSVVKTRVKSVIEPFMIDDLDTMIATLASATGGKPILSQKSAIAQSGLVDDPEAEYAQLQEEQDRANTLDLFPSAA